MTDQTTKEKRKSKEHGELHYNELTPVLHGADRARRFPVCGFEFTIKVAILKGDSAEIAPTPNVKLWDSVTDWWRATPFLAQYHFESI
jgi:hypothetical protein